MALEILRFLRAGKPLEELDREFHISARRHGNYPNLVLLKYSQADSPMSERIVQECRGIILDEADDWKPVCVPYFKFFNYGDPKAALIDWSTARVYEKLDGSLMTLYWYDGAWQVSSSGMPDAAGATEFGQTFAELFWETFNTLHYRLPSPGSNVCAMFELMTPYNRIIVPHRENRLVLHGLRDRVTLEESAPELADGLGWELVRRYPLDTIEHVLASCESINPLECEGYVVCDENFNRIKVKSPQYVALAHMKDSMSTRRMIEIVRANESDEFLVHFPEFRPMYDMVRGKFDALVLELEAAYASIQHIAEQKAFALEAVKSRFSSALFSIRGGKSETIRQYLATCTQPSLERVLGIDADALAIESASSTSGSVRGKNETGRENANNRT